MRASSSAMRASLSAMRASLFAAMLASSALAAAFAGTASVDSPAADLQSPVGVWKTIDDKTGKPHGVVRIYIQDGKYFGRVEQSFVPGAESRVCSKCTDQRKNQPVIGLVIIRNMISRDGEYSGGDILDPDTGTVYGCKFHLEHDGTILVVRGFIGFSLLGRSQIWHRQL